MAKVVSFGGSSGAGHSHSNQSVLDGISVINGVLFYNNFASNPAQFSGLLYWFESRFLSGYTENQKVSSLINNVGNTISTQSTSTQQAIYKGNLAGGKPALEFSDAQFYPIDLTSLTGSYYTFSFVESRKSGKGENYLFGNQVAGGNAGLHIGYRSGTEYTLAQYSNDFNCTISEYSSPINRIWICSYNVRGFEIWLNRNRLGQRSNSQGLTSCPNGNFGRGFGANHFIGLCSGFAIHLGNRSESEIQDLSDYWNSQYLVY